MATTPPTASVDLAMSYCFLNANLFPCNATVFNTLAAGGVSAVFGLGMVFYLNSRIKAQPRGNDTMNKISDQISLGARSFLRTEYTYLTVFVIALSLVLLGLYTIHPPSGQRVDGVRYAACFLSGATLSALAGWRGMAVATDANVRTTEAAATEGLSRALFVSFSGGAVMGFSVVSFGLFGLSLLFCLITLGDTGNPDYLNHAADTVAAFGFGASSIALFARVAGGIYTKAADVGADLVGKVELGIPEDDPRNPAVIADNVGDNVGDVAGMGADLFESYVGAIIATVTLADGDMGLIMLPFCVCGTGILASMLAFFTVRVRSSETAVSQEQLMFAIHRGNFVASLLVLAGSAGFIVWFFDGRTAFGLRILACIFVGLLAGVSIGIVTEYFTSYAHPPTQSITDAGQTGPASVIIQGLGVGMISTVFPVLIIMATTLGCHALAGDYGISVSAVGMLSTLGITLAADAFGPIADNAGGIAEMAGLDESVRQITDALDALGNTTAATGKGFAIGSAVLTSVSLLTAFTEKVNAGDVSIGSPLVLSGVLLGSMLPYLFAALTMLSVQKAAGAIIQEVRRQFREIPGLREGTAEADSNKCIEISTKSSVQEMMLPGVYAIFTPLAVGFLMGPRCLTGLLGGSIASGMMLAIMMANAGGAWDNAKKYIEIGNAHGGKGTETHKAVVVGDTVGDPFKDTSGPALNILIKLMSIISLTIAPLIEGHGDWEDWWKGTIPLGLMLFFTVLFYCLFWRHKQDYTTSSNNSERTLLETEKLVEIA